MRKFSPQNLGRGVLWRSKSEQSAKVLSVKIAFSPIRESFLPWKFTAIRYIICVLNVPKHSQLHTRVYIAKVLYTLQCHYSFVSLFIAPWVEGKWLIPKPQPCIIVTQLLWLSPLMWHGSMLAILPNFALFCLLVCMLWVINTYELGTSDIPGTSPYHAMPFDYIIGSPCNWLLWRFFVQHETSIITASVTMPTPNVTNRSVLSPSESPLAVPVYVCT